MKWPKSYTRQSTLLTAYHEAGHAVVVLHGGKPFDDVSISVTRLHASGVVTVQAHHSPRHAIMVCYAGQAAVKILLEQYVQAGQLERRHVRRLASGNTNDRQQARKLAAQEGIGREALAKLEESTYRFLSRKEVWADVVCVAEALMKRKKMTMREAEAVIADAQDTARKSKPKRKTLFE
jgi:hypothetical protein